MFRKCDRATVVEKTVTCYNVAAGIFYPKVKQLNSFF
jgi:hypothetical protein